MSWFIEGKHKWRAAILLGMIVAFLGPWLFDRINVPSDYACSDPNIRLDDDFCGVPLSGIRFFLWMIPCLLSSSIGLVTGTLTLSDWIRQILFNLHLFILLMPIISTLLLILRGDRRRRQIFAITTWGLAIGIGLLWGLTNYPSLFWVVWGIWLYVGLAVSALILEYKTCSQERKKGEGL